MKNNYIVFLIVILCFSFTSAQIRVSLNLGPSSYLYNSENGSLIMGDRNFRYQLNYGLSVQKDNLLGLNVLFDYNYSSNKQANVVEVITTHQSSPTVARKDYGHITFSAHNFDLSYNYSISKYFSFGAGPSFVITNRKFTFYPNAQEVKGLFINDMLAGSGLGGNAFFMFTMPFSEQSPFFFGGKVKLRYTHSIWFDEGIRVLDNYKQSLLTTEINAGIGIIL